MGGLAALKNHEQLKEDSQISSAGKMLYHCLKETKIALSNSFRADIRVVQDILKSYLNLATDLHLIIIINSGQQECQFCSGKFAEIHKIMVHSVSLQ